MKKTALILILLFVSFAIPCYAGHPLVSDDAGTLGKGTIQIELNSDIGTDKETRDGITTKVHSSQIASTIGTGITDKIDITIGFTRPWNHGDENGVSFNDPGSADLSVSMKFQLFEHNSFSVALKPQLTYSYMVGAPDNEKTTGYGTALILSKDLEPFSFHLNAGYTYNNYNLASARDANRNNIWNFSLAATYEIIKEKLKAVADFGAATNEDKSNSEVPVFGLAGVIYTVNKNLDLSVGLKAGLTKPETDLTGTFGLTMKF